MKIWIPFWGSYLGAIIGALTVYIVTNMQIKEQREIQLKSIEQNNENAIDREMRKYYLQIQISKTEEANKIIEDLVDILMKISNDFTRYMVCSDILHGGRDRVTDEKKKELLEEIRTHRGELHNKIHIINGLNFRLDRLKLYFDDISLHVDSIGEKISNLIKIYKEESYKKEAYINYDPYGEKPPLQKYIDGISIETSILITKIDSNLECKLDEIKNG